MKPIEIIEKFDAYLYKKNLKFEAIVIGGAALSVMGVISRETQDVDILDPTIPPEIIEASKEFAKLESIAETSLKENWLNNGPDSLKKFLKENWYLRLTPLYQGKSITFKTLGRIDLIGTKILAYCDRGTDLKDCIDLRPSLEEIIEVLPWVQSYDLNPDWPQYVLNRVEVLKEKLGYGI